MIDIGWLIGNIIGGILMLLTIIYIIWASFHKFSEFDGSKTLWVLGGIAAFLAQILISIVFNFPFDMNYHSFHPISGTVAEANSRLLPADDKSMQQKYAIRFEGNDQIYGCTDTRCSLAKKGDKLTLACERQWQYASVPGYDCRYYR